MISQVFVLLFAGLMAIEVNSVEIKDLRSKSSNINPRALIDEANEQLDNLRQTVRGAIFTASDDLETFGLDIGTYGDNILQNGQLDIQQEHETIVAEVQVLRDLGETAGVDVSPCINIREQIINLLPAEYTGQMRVCIFNTDVETQRILRDANYRADIYTNQVNALEFQLGFCEADSITCISSIVTQIELASVQLPQNIRIEVDRAQDLLETVKISIQDCSDTKVAQYAGDANALLSDIADCVNDVLSGGPETTSVNTETSVITETSPTTETTGTTSALLL